MNLIKLKSLLGVLLCVDALVASAQENIRFAPTWDSGWQHHVHSKVCTLLLPLPQYGEARFVSTSADTPAFELQARLDMHQSGPINVTKFTPGWHPAEPGRSELGVLTHIDGGGAVARGALAASMLLSLREGFHLQLSSGAWFDQAAEVSLALTAKDLQPALDRFLRCARTQVDVSWQQISRTRISYAVDAHTLDDEARARLRNLVRYVVQDKSVTMLYVDGHTDNSGIKSKNYQLAKRRAETVAGFLQSLLQEFLQKNGLPDHKLVVRYHGADYPVADNKTIAGKARNRRTTVRLAREDALAGAGR